MTALVRKLTGDPPAIKLPAGAIDTQVHLYMDGYPAVAPGPPVPDGTPGIAEYRKVMEWLGIDRLVVTIGNTHQFDDACLLACLRELGPIAKGVAAIRPDTSDADMERLTAGGVCGARIMDLPGGAAGLSDLAGVDNRARDHGWVVAVQFDGNHILDLEHKLAAMRSNWILDHHGKFFTGAAPDSPEISVVKRLLDKGNCWFKFAACYESSVTGGPDYADVAAVARELAAYAPERIIWGTNWPHNLIRATENYPDDAKLLDTVLGWVPGDHLKKTVVDNPAALFGF